MSIFNLNSVERVMVFGAHPDDEIIGPGGSIHNLSARGKEVYVVTFTGGGTAANSAEEMAAMVQVRQREMAECDRILGVTKREFLQIPSQQVYAGVYSNLRVADQYAVAKDGGLTLHHTLIHLIRKYQPQLLFSHTPDNHRDHCGIANITSQSAFQASESILEHLGAPWSIPLVLSYSVEKELQGEYVPNIVLEIGKEDLDAKLDAMKTQVSQTRGDYLGHFLQMIEGRSGLWGAKHFGYGRYAEPFHMNDDAPIRIDMGK